jgi:uncharacterized membrane protein YkoI
LVQQGFSILDTMKITMTIIFALTAATSAHAAGPAPALNGPVLAQATPLPQSGRSVIAFRDAIDRVLERYEGEIVEAELKRGRPGEYTDIVYEMRLLTAQGNMLRIRVDAASGDILEVDGRGLTRARRPN